MQRVNEVRDIVFEDMERLRLVGMASGIVDAQWRRSDELADTVAEGRRVGETTLQKLRILVDTVRHKAVVTESDVERAGRLQAEFEAAMAPLDERIAQASQMLQMQHQQADTRQFLKAQKQAKQHLQAQRHLRGGAAGLVDQLLHGPIPAAQRLARRPPPLEPLSPSVQDRQRLQRILGAQAIKKQQQQSS